MSRYKKKKLPSNLLFYTYKSKTVYLSKLEE